jgi:hypothetical protein
MKRTLTILVASASLAALAACDSGSTPPENTRLLMTNGSDSSGAVRVDTTTYSTDPVLVWGRVVAIAEIVPQPGSNDTLRFEPVSGATVRLVRNVRVNGVVEQESVAQTTSGPDGDYRVESVPGGYYIIDVTVPASSPYISGYGYLHALPPMATQVVHLRKKP